MLVRYWQPWREVEALRRQFDQMFDELTTPTTEQVDWTPAIELKDTGNELVLRVQLPGINANDVDVQVAKQGVSISGHYQHEHQTEENSYFKSEFRYGNFRRVVPLPLAVKNERVTADYTDGILTLTLPKIEEVRNKVVKVNLTGSHPTPEVTPATDAASPETPATDDAALTANG